MVRRVQGTVLTRKQLYRLVWAVPIQQLASEMGLSDVAVGKLCRKNDVPTPPRGYWARRGAGQHVSAARFVESDLGTADTVFLKGELSPDLVEAAGPSQDDGISPAEAHARALGAFRTRLGQVAAAPSLKTPLHPEVQKLLSPDKERTWDNFRLHYVYKPAWHTPLQHRKLRLLQGLFRAIQRVGGRCKVDFDGKVDIELAGTSLELMFVELRARRGRDAGNDGLGIELRHTPSNPEIKTRWADDPAQPLEKQLTDIIVGLAIAGEDKRKEEELWAIQRAQEIEVEDRRQADLRITELDRKAHLAELAAEQAERERLAAVAKAKLAELIAEATAWSQAEAIRAYVAAAGQQRSGAKFDDWAAWALAEADKLDPMTGA